MSYISCSIYCPVFNPILNVPSMCHVFYGLLVHLQVTTCAILNRAVSVSLKKSDLINFVLRPGLQIRRKIQPPLYGKNLFESGYPMPLHCTACQYTEQSLSLRKQNPVCTTFNRSFEHTFYQTQESLKHKSISHDLGMFAFSTFN